METAKFECRICIDTPRMPVVTRCGHFFCLECIERWMEQRQAMIVCPVCKAGISKETIIRMKLDESSQNKANNPTPSEQANVPNAQSPRPAPQSTSQASHSPGDTLSLIVKSLIIFALILVVFNVGFSKDL